MAGYPNEPLKDPVRPYENTVAEVVKAAFTPPQEDETMDEMKDFSARYAADLKAALTTASAEAEAKDAEIARLREAGNVLRDKLLGFVGAMAMYADCGPDVEAIKAWEAI